jgi:uncharacterized Zn finger protein
MVTRAGPLEMRKNDDKLKIETPTDASRQLLTNEKDGTLSIARNDVVTLDLRNDDDDRVSFARSGKDGMSSVWNVSSNDGDNVRIQQDEHGKTSSVRANSGGDSVNIENGTVDIEDGHHRIRVSGSQSENHYLVLMLPIGVLGLFFWIWLTRVSWRAVARFVKRQIDVVSASLDREQNI